jgi:alpha-tubulin suppressor-like RCC1 family protein
MHAARFSHLISAGLITLATAGCQHPSQVTFIAVSAGTFPTCGVTVVGATYCWGANVHGQLGDANRRLHSLPVLVAGGLSFAAVSAGGAHTCGRTAAGAAYC